MKRFITEKAYTHSGALGWLGWGILSGADTFTSLWWFGTILFLISLGCLMYHNTVLLKSHD